MKAKITSFFALATILLWPRLLCAQHIHINAGASNTTQNAQLYFVNGYVYGTNAGYDVYLTYTNAGSFSNLYQGAGLTFTALTEAHPEFVAGWQRGEDPCFPQGENTAAVAARLDSFLGKLPPEPSLVVTHNVVLRCLLGIGLRLPMSCWHQIPVAHLESFEVLRLNGVSYLDLSPSQIAGVSDALVGHLQ